MFLNDPPVALRELLPPAWRGIIGFAGEAEAGSAGEQPTKE